jgi:MarR family transcriptional regulator for hemolysin
MEQFLGRQLGMTAKAFKAEFDARLSEVGGSLTTFILLRTAGEPRREAVLSQRELAKKMGVEGPTLVRHLDRLEGQGLIQRRRDPQDRRVTRVAVTPAGEKLLKSLRRVAEAMDADVRSLLGPEGYDVLHRGLKQLEQHVAALAAERRTDARAAL